MPKCRHANLAGAWAERIVTETQGSAGRPARVVGVSLRGGSPGTSGHGLRIAVAARLVVAAGGSLHTPALLLRSGIQGRGNVGRHLHLHPVCMTLGFLRSPPRLDAAVGLAGAATTPLPDLEDRGGRPASNHGSVQLWDGTGMSTFSAARGDWEGSGYGSLLYTPQVLPGSVLSSMPWLGQADFKKYMARLPDASLFLTIVRDREEGSITLAVEPRVPSSETELLQHVLDTKVLPSAGTLPVALRRVASSCRGVPCLHPAAPVGLKCQRCMQYKDQSYSPRMLLDKFLQNVGCKPG